MSRIGKKPIVLPAGVTVTINGSNVEVKGPKGTLNRTFDSLVTIKQEGNELIVTRPNDEIRSRAMHGTTRALLHDMVIGVSEGFKKELEINGVGYRFQVSGNKVTISAGYSHPVEMIAPEGIKLEMPDKSQTELTVSGYDKQAVSEFAANIRKVRQPEPYKGKGIKYKDEHIRRKEGKKAA